MFKGLASLPSLIKQAQEMGSKMGALSEELKSKRVQGSAGGGMVTIEANGLGEVLKVSIDPELFARQDREMIEDLLPAAINQVQAKAKQLHAEQMRSMTDGMNLPGLDEALAQFGGTSPEKTT